MLTARQVDLVQESFVQLQGHGSLFGRAFYERMFERNPNIRHLFKGDEEAQAAKFVEMIATLVAGLNRIEQLKPAVHHLGLRHVHYGVRPHDYPVFGEALIWTLERFLGPALDRETREAWTAFYDTLVEQMAGPLDHVAKPALAKCGAKEEPLPGAPTVNSEGGDG